MKKNYLSKFSIALLLLFSTVGYSQYFEPVPVAGFNVDGVAETAPAAGSTNSGLDGSNNCVYTKSYATGGGMSGGLPDNGIVNRCFDSYQFAPYNQNNVLYLGGSQSGTLTFNTPKAYTTLNVVGFGSNGTKGFTSVVNFTDGTSQTVTGFNFPDWDYYVAPDFILSGFGRSLRSPDYVSYTTAVNMHKVTLDISAANQTKLVASVTFTADSNFPNHISIMAVSGIPYVQIPVTGQCGAVVNYTLPTTNFAPILPKVLLLAHDQDININDVKAKLVATNQFGVVDTHNLNTQGIPTLAQLNGYNAILFWGNNFYSGSASIGTVIKSYIDNGGGVVEGAYSNALAVNLPAGYNFFSSAPAGYTYLTATLGAIALPSHPIMDNVNSFTNTGAVHSSYSLVPTAYLVASYTYSSYRLAVAMENVGPAKAKRALLCFSPPSKDVLNNSWNSSTDGAKIMANALKWVANPYTQTAGLPSGSIFPVGTTTNTYTYYDSSNVQQTCSFDVVVKDTQVPVAISKNITVTLSPAGTVTVAPANVDNGSTDNCGTPTLSLNKTSFDQTNIGSNLVTLTATDASGNTAITTAIVTVLPSDYDNITVSNTTGQCGTIVNYATPTFNVVKPKLLLLFHDTIIPGEANDVKAKLTASAQFDAVDILDLSVTTPTIAQLKQYDAILAWNNNVSSNPAAVGDLLADYIDLGGGLTDAIFDNAADNFLGRFNTPAYRVLMPAPQASGTVRSLGSVQLPTHPIIAGITAFNAGPESYVSTSTTISPSSYIIASYDNSLPLIIAKENTGLSAAKRVSLNFFPPSTTVTSAGWGQATQGAQIMANALKWSAKRIPVQVAGLPAGSVFPVGTTTNTFEYTDSNNVVHTFSFDVIVNDTENPVITCIPDATTTNCDGTFTFTAPVFSDNCPSSVLTQTAGLASGSVFPIGQTLNTFLVTDASGNTATCSFTVTRNADLSATTAQTDVLCNGSATGAASVLATGGTGIGTYTYLWSNGQTTDAITNVTAGTYSVTIKDGNGCELIKNFTITQPAQPLATTPNTTQVNVLCFGNTTGSATIAVNGGTAPYTYLWNNGATTNSITGLAAGTYTVDVTDANACVLPHSFTITQPIAPLATTPNTTQVNVLCNGNATGSATVAVNGGTAPYTYVWNNGSTTASITNVTAGTYTVGVTDANGCTLSHSFIITEPVAPLALTPNTSQVDVFCFGNATGS
ncbi:HYR domain-containing protein, partial [Flavobacterium sp. DG1-102-2]|uniref:HYR domain-containing protein n=1 Tax=Flavobacterium sp. DG1-102-2 TaxID=3081663 RepID=UPI00294A94E7